MVGAVYAVKAVVKSRVGDLRAFAKEIDVLRELVSISDSQCDGITQPI